MAPAVEKARPTAPVDERAAPRARPGPGGRSARSRSRWARRGGWRGSARAPPGPTTAPGRVGSPGRLGRQRRRCGSRGGRGSSRRTGLRGPCRARRWCGSRRRSCPGCGRSWSHSRARRARRRRTPGGGRCARRRRAPGVDARTVRLPASYVAEHVELGYATTIARTQGMTVDETHTIAAPGMGREDLYVAMSRGRHLNRTYVVVDQGDPDCLPGHEPASCREVLEQILATSHAEPSATETWQTYHPDQAAPVVPPARPQEPWGAPSPQPAPYRLTPVPPPIPDGPVLGL